jgi:hypothetical protein
MLHDPLTHAASDDGPAPVPRDARQRPVVLSVASRRPRFRHRPATRSVASGFSLLLLSLLTLTMISAWAGWQVAVSAPCTTVLTESPAVPLGTPAVPTGPEAQAVQAPGTAAAPAPAPAPAPGPVAELVGEPARTPAESGVAHEQTTLVQVATVTTTTATVTQDHSAAPATGPVIAATAPPGEPTRLTGSAGAAAATTGSADPPPAAPPPAAPPPAAPPPAVPPPAPAPVASHAATPRPAATTAATPRPVTTTAPRHCDDCSAAPGSAPAPTASSPPQDARPQPSRDEDGRHQDGRHQDTRVQDTRAQDTRAQDTPPQDAQWSSHRRHHRSGHDQEAAAP